jgi:hypothetical protein
VNETPANLEPAMKTRTVCLTPIRPEVVSYVEWLKKEGIVVVSVVWPTLPGRDVRVTFEV